MHGYFNPTMIGYFYATLGGRFRPTLTNVWNIDRKGINMAEEKKKIKKMPKKLRIFLVVLVCIILIFPVYTVFKRISLYIECSEIKEYRTKEIVDNPNDYDIDLNKLILMINIYYYGMEPSYHLYIFEDGRVFTGVIQNVEQLCEHGKALERMDAGAMLNNVDMCYLGSISGNELYNILVLRAKSDFSADHYDADDEYERKFYGIMEAPPKRIGAEVDPWINAENYVSGSPTMKVMRVFWRLECMLLRVLVV